MPRWTITHRGVPVAALAAPGLEQLGAVAATPLPAFEPLRPALASIWRDANDDDAAFHQPAAHSAAAPDLELWDERGDAVPTSRLELIVTGPYSAVAFVAVDTSGARVAAPVRLRPRGAIDASPEA
jgi:hypothetical protein